MSSDHPGSSRSRKRKISSSPCVEEEDSSWTTEEKEKFVTALSKGPPYRHENGSINWMQLKRYIGTKSLQDVKVFAKRFHAMEHGSTYPEFCTRSTIDVWRYLAEKTKTEGDNIADTCIPQVLTVAAHEPLNNTASSNSELSASTSQSSASSPEHPACYKNIYNYLSAITRGVDPPELNITEAAILLDVLENLIRTLSKSQTLIQREFLHTQYKELRDFLGTEGSTPELPTNSNTESRTNYSSTNPFGIPFEILNFKLFEQSEESESNEKESKKK